MFFYSASTYGISHPRTGAKRFSRTARGAVDHGLRRFRIARVLQRSARTPRQRFEVSRPRSFDCHDPPAVVAINLPARFLGSAVPAQPRLCPLLGRVSPWDPARLHSRSSRWVCGLKCISRGQCLLKGCEKPFEPVRAPIDFNLPLPAAEPDVAVCAHCPSSDSSTFLTSASISGIFISSACTS